MEEWLASHGLDTHDAQMHLGTLCVMTSPERYGQDSHPLKLPISSMQALIEAGFVEEVGESEYRGTKALKWLLDMMGAVSY